MVLDNKIIIKLNIHLFYMYYITLFNLIYIKYIIYDNIVFHLRGMLHDACLSMYRDRK